MPLKQIYALLITLFVVSCSSPTAQKEDTNTQEKTEHEANEHDNHNNHDKHENHQEQTSELNIELNEGEKWEVNQEMKTPIATMKTELQSYIDSKSTDHQKLAIDLDSNTNLLIKTCTMKGKSHEELHKWLVPHIALVKELTDAKNEEQANQKVKAIQDLFVVFNQNFK